MDRLIQTYRGRLTETDRQRVRLTEIETHRETD